MAISFLSIQADVQSQLNALIATTPTVTETTYSAVVAGTSVVADRTSTDWGLPQIQNALLDTEYDLIKEICFNSRHPERSSFNAVSDPLSNPAALPIVDNAGIHFLGQFNYVVQSGTEILLRERELQVTQWSIQNSSSAFSNPLVLIYSIVGGWLYHNSPTAVMLQGTAADRNTCVANVYTPFSAIRVREYYRPAIVAGALVRLLAKEGAWLDAMQANAAIYKDQIDQIRSVNQQMAVPYTAR